MWLKYAQLMQVQSPTDTPTRKLVEVGYPPRSEFIDMSVFESDDNVLGDPTLEQYAQEYPEDVDGDLMVRIFDREGRRKTYTYPNQDLATARDVAQLGGNGFHAHNLREAPFI